jgi:hypothetical protein
MAGEDKLDRQLSGALRHWADHLAALGYDEVRKRYVGQPVAQEFFEHAGHRYEVTTDAVANGRGRGDIRLLIEVSDSELQPPREIAAEDFILGEDGTVT